MAPTGGIAGGIKRTPITEEDIKPTAPIYKAPPTSNIQTSGFMTQAASSHHDEEGTSLYNMYGFKQSEGNIQDVFKFVPAAKNMLISEN